MGKSKHLPCAGCGLPITRTSSTDRRRYHSSDCRSRCSVDSCAEPVKANGWCSAHARRAVHTGDPVSYTGRGRNRGECSVEGCSDPMRKRTWCASHYSMWVREGEVHPFNYQWNGRSAECIVCSQPTVSGLRRFCSVKCAQRYRRAGGPPPDALPCAICGIAIEMVRADGSRRRSDTKTCRRCRIDRRKHGMSVTQLAVRDGAECGICQQPVDMSARAPDPLRPSVDHIWPRALGGSNDPANLQLAHLSCNQSKRDRVPA